MAGTKGMKGGGGARPGAGRKPLPKPPVVELPETDMLSLLQKVALGQLEASPIQVRAAIAAVQYTHAKKGEGGKKDEQDDKAKRAARGKFAAAAPPLKLVSR
jgi:phage terminase small subunit